MTDLLLRLNRYALVILVTIASLFFSIITSQVGYLFSDHDIHFIDYFLVAFIPLVVAPIVTWHLITILHRLKQQDEEKRGLIEALRQEHERLNRSQKIARLGSWHLDLINDQLSWSDEIYEIFEIDKARFRASYEAFLELVHPEDRVNVNEAYMQSLADQKPYGIEHRLLMPDGRVKYVREECVSEFDASGKALYSEGTVQDITEQVMIRKDNQEKEYMLAQQAKMAQMGEMLSNIAHQWKQPLAQLNSVVIDMDRTYGTDQFDEVYFNGRLDRIEELTLYMSETIEQFKTYFDPNKLKSYFDAPEPVQSALALLDPVLKQAKVRIVTERMSQARVHGYKQDLIQVLLVLMSNALDALQESQCENPTLSIDVHEFNRKIHYVVSDNAGGIDPAIVDRIFEPYFTTKEHKGGTGLGLYMAKTMVENGMKGTLQLETAPEGTRFTISLKIQ